MHYAVCCARQCIYINDAEEKAMQVHMQTPWLGGACLLNAVFCLKCLRLPVFLRAEYTSPRPPNKHQKHCCTRVSSKPQSSWHTLHCTSGMSTSLWLLCVESSLPLWLVDKDQMWLGSVAQHKCSF